MQFVKEWVWRTQRFWKKYNDKGANNMHMMDTPLLLTSFFERAERYFGHKKIYSRTAPDTVQTFTYEQYCERTRRLASALTKLGMSKGTKVGTFCWNDHRHLEAYFAVPCSEAILHTVNIRLSPEHIVYVINHAEDEILLVDQTLLQLIEAVAPQLKTVKTFIICGDNVDLSSTTLPNAYDYDTLVAEGDPSHHFSDHFDENTPAGMCYTSATTGMPKGVVYTHRSIVLHSLALMFADGFGICERDTLLPIVPMFHVNAWGMPFACVNIGATQVMPGPFFTPDILLDLIEEYDVTISAGVPTVWLGVVQAQKVKPRKIDTLRLIVNGGSAAPVSLVEAFDAWGVTFYTGYGMTETSPLVSITIDTSETPKQSHEAIMHNRTLQGIASPLVDVRIINENGDVPFDGKTMGEIIVRGPWIAAQYYNDERTIDAFKDGWLHTGDIAVYTPEGYIQITDRTKDLIKSGGEWISSIEIENALMTHEKVAEAAVIAVPHPKWQERPLACVVVHEAFKQNITKEELFAHLQQDFAKLWIPDDIVFLEEIPKTSVGKFLKAQLREEMKDYQLPQ